MNTTQSTYCDPFACPECGKTGSWRTGWEFDHQVWCSRCHVVWCPDEVIERNRELAQSKLNTDGDGI